jgi:hypothetical protein
MTNVTAWADFELDKTTVQKCALFGGHAISYISGTLLLFADRLCTPAKQVCVVILPTIFA